MIRAVRLAVEGVGWAAVGFGALVVLYDAMPTLGCRLIGHTPAAWVPVRFGSDLQKTFCLHCEAGLVREGKPDRAFAA